MPEPETTVTDDATVTRAASAEPGMGRAGWATLLLVAVLVVCAIGIVGARRGRVPTSTGDATAATAPRAVGTPGPALPIQRIAGLAELPGGPVEHVEVAYFHRTHRCSGCINAERLTRETLDTRFAERMRNGDMNLVVEDTEAPADPALVGRYEAWGSALFLSVSKGGQVYTWRDDEIWFYVNEDHKFIGHLVKQIRAIYGEA